MATCSIRWIIETFGYIWLRHGRRCGAAAAGTDLWEQRILQQAKSSAQTKKGTFKIAEMLEQMKINWDSRSRDNSIDALYPIHLIEFIGIERHSTQRTDVIGNRQSHVTLEYT